MTTMDVMQGIPHFLWTTSWQAGVMAGAIWIACRQWSRMPANLRVMLWWLVSLKFVIGLAWTQPIPLPVLPASLAPGDSSIASGGSITHSGATGSSLTTGSSVTTGSNGATGSSGASRGNGAIGSSGAIGNAWTSTANAIAGYGLAVAAGCWLLGIFLQGALLLRQLVRTRQLVARSQPVEGDAVELFDDLLARLDLRGSRPRLRVSTEVLTPQVIGLTRPVILLPVSALESFTTRELSLTLCHELMHVQRFDLWHGWIPSVAARLFFFHPLARLAAREYAIAREAACDARVLAFMQAPAYDYGRLLMRLGITAREAAPAAAGASPTLRTLKRRLLMLHDASPHARRLSPRWWALAAIASVLVLPISPTAQQREAEPREYTVRAAEVLQSADARQAPQRHERKGDPKDAAKGEHGEPWVFLQSERNASMHGSSLDLVEAKRLRGNSSEPLIWFKRDGRAYVIRDRQLLDKVHALFIPQDELGKTMEQLGRRQEILGDRQAALGENQAALGELVAAFHEKVNEAADRLLKTVDSGLPHSEDTKLKAAAESRVREAEATRRQISADQEALGQQQRALGEQQAALGAEQAALGRQQEELSRAITWELRVLFDSAIAAGLATPVK